MRIKIMNLTRQIAVALYLATALAPRCAHADDKAALAKARAKLEKQDAALNKIYTSLAASLGKAQAAELRADERAWLDYRDHMADAAPWFNTGSNPDDPKTTVDYWHAMESFTSERVDFLRAWTGKSVPPGITGEYSDCHGGDLDLEETNSGVKFRITAVRGTRAHIGEIGGVIHPRDGAARFVETLDATIAPAEPSCELTFTFIDGHIVKISQKNHDPNAGSGVWYEGTYRKMGRLKKPIGDPSSYQ